MSLFCRHNRFTADCPICSAGTVLDSSASSAGRRRSTGKKAGGGTRAPASPAFSGPNVFTGPYDTDAGRLVVRLERVPGGVRIGTWNAGKLLPQAPTLPAADLVELAGRAEEALAARDAKLFTAALDPGPGRDQGVSRGRTGDFKEELRIEPLDDGQVRIARWVLRPNQGWELQDAAPMLPAKRFADALAGAVRAGILTASPSDQPVEPRP